MTTGVIFAEGLHRNGRSSWEERPGQREEAVQAAVGQLCSGAGSELALEPDPGPSSSRHTCGPAPGVSILSQTLQVGLGSAAGSQQDRLIPSLRKSFIKDMQSQRRPSVSCLWAASRTRRQASDMPCRSVPPGSAYLPASPLPRFSHMTVLGANDVRVCTS